MKTTFNYLIIFLILFGCSANNKKNDLQRENLKGNVKSVKEVSYDVLRHRIILSYEAESEELSAEQVIEKILSFVPVP